MRNHFKTLRDRRFFIKTMWKEFICGLMILIGFFSVNAQKNGKTNKSTKKKTDLVIRLAEKNITVKGSIFNEITYNFSTGKSKTVAYQYLDKVKNELVITEVYYDFEDDEIKVSMIEIYICPLDNINKQNSYVLEMEHDSVAGGKVFRLTLLSNGQGIDNLYFRRKTESNIDNESKSMMVNNVTINFTKQSEAEMWLAKFLNNN